MQKKLKIGNLEVTLIKKDIKNLHLNVLPPLGNVRVSVPKKIDDEAVRLFVISKLSWIKKQIKKFKSQDRETKREFVSGESHYFKGNRYILNVIPHNSPPKVVIKNKKNIDFYIKKTLNREQREKAFYNWYRKELKIILSEIISKWETIIGVKSNTHKIRIMKTKWGTCNQKTKEIRFNLELIKKSLIQLEYIVVHELIHLIERTHNSIFISHLNTHMPDWRTHKQELNSSILVYDVWNE